MADVAKAEDLKTKDSNGNTDDKPKIELTPEEKKVIVKQLEYYFGDFNLSKDKFMKEQMSLDNGWIPMSVLLTFKRLAQLCSEAEPIVSCILESGTKLIEVNEDRTKLRRHPDNPLPETDDLREQFIKRTAYVKGFPADETYENIREFMEPYGPYESINLRHYLDKATKNNIFKGSIFAVFKDIDTCKKFVEIEDLKYKDNELIHIWQSDFFEEKTKEREERMSKKKGKEEAKKAKEDPKKPPPLAKGAILHVKGLKNTTYREALKAKVTEIGGVEPVFITFEQGKTEGYVRFGVENGAVDFVKKLTDNKFEVEAASVEARALEGEEEEKYLEELTETLSKIRNQNRNTTRNKKRKMYGDGGPRSKYSRK